MKKLVALSLALLLVLSLTVASAEAYSAHGYYTIDYPATLTLDDTSYTDENTTDDIWLFMLSDDAYLIDAYITKLDDYAGFSLYSATDAEKETYVKDTLDAYADQNAALADTLVTAEGIPFYVYAMEESDGVYYFAETIANGASINFCCYYDDAKKPLDSALLTNLEAVLSTFVTGRRKHRNPNKQRQQHQRR